MFGHSRPHFYHKRLTLNSTIKIRSRLISTSVRKVEVALRNYPNFLVVKIKLNPPLQIPPFMVKWILCEISAGKHEARQQVSYDK